MPCVALCRTVDGGQALVRGVVHICIVGKWREHGNLITDMCRLEIAWHKFGDVVSAVDVGSCLCTKDARDATAQERSPTRWRRLQMESIW